MEDVKTLTAFLSLSDGQETFYHAFMPKKEAHSGILLIHGFGEHSGRYQELGAFLAAAGYAVFAPDARGHGRSSGRRGHVLRFDQYLDDLEAFMAKIRIRYPHIEQYFIVGHSMGGLIALRFALRTQDQYRGVVLSNPLLGLALEVPPLKRALGLAMSRLVPTLTLGNEINPDHLSRDLEVGKRYVADPLVHHLVSARWFTETLDAMSQSVAVAPLRLRIPTLFMVSTADRLTDHKVSLGLFEALKTENKTLKLYEGLFHEIFNEIGHEAIFEELLSWLEQLSSARG